MRMPGFIALIGLSVMTAIGVATVRGGRALFESVSGLEGIVARLGASIVIVFVLSITLLTVQSRRRRD